MKKIVLLLTVLVATCSLSSCGAFANMSEQEAYDTGYSIGSAIRQLQENRQY